MSDVGPRNARRAFHAEDAGRGVEQKVEVLRRTIVYEDGSFDSRRRQAARMDSGLLPTRPPSTDSLSKRQYASMDAETEIGSQTLTASAPPFATAGSNAIVFDTKSHSQSISFSTPTTAPTSPSQRPAGSIAPSVQQALIAAGAVGAVVVLIMFLWIFFRIRRKRKTRERQSLSTSPKKAGGTAVQYNFNSPPSGLTAWSSPLPPFTEHKEIYIPDNTPLKSPSYTNMAMESPSLYSIQGHSIGHQSPGFNSTYVNSPSTQSPAMTSPGIQTPPSQPGHFPIPPVPSLGRSIASPAKNAYLMPAPLQMYNTQQPSPTGTGPFHFDDPPTTTFQPPFPRRPSTCHTIAELHAADDGGLSVIGEEIDEYLSNSNPNSRQSPKASRTPSTYSVGRRSFRERASVAVSIATSVESVPRFRTINSWVNHQSNRLEGKTTPSRSPSSGSGENSHHSSRENLPQVPAIPSSTPGYGSGDVRRMDSTSTATIFRQHPGEKIEIGRESMIPSDVLDQDLNLV